MTLALLAAFAVLVPIAGCSGDDDAATPDDVAPLPGLPTAPPVSSPVDDSPFCRAMLDLAADEPDSADDSELGLDGVLDVYLGVADEAPAEIRPDFDVVVDQLRTLVAGGEVVDQAGAEESAIVLSAYVELNCRGTSQSPLPPPTAPVGDLEGTDG